MVDAAHVLCMEPQSESTARHGQFSSRRATFPTWITGVDDAQDIAPFTGAAGPAADILGGFYRFIADISSYIRYGLVHLYRGGHGLLAALPSFIFKGLLSLLSLAGHPFLRATAVSSICCILVAVGQLCIFVVGLLFSLLCILYHQVRDIHR